MNSARRGNRAYTKPMNRPAVTIDTHNRMEIEAELAARAGADGHPRRQLLTDERLEDQGLRPANNSRSNFNRRRDYRRVSRLQGKTAACRSTCMRRQAMPGKQRAATCETRWCGIVQPSRRKSRTVMVPTRAAMPRRCTVSIAGKSQSDWRMAAPTEVRSSQWQNSSMAKG